MRASSLPAIPVVEDEDRVRAIVIVRENEEKIGQEYVHPLLVLSGDEYAAMPFQVVHDRICDSLRGNQPRLIAEAIDGGGRRLIFEDGLVVDEDEELP